MTRSTPYEDLPEFLTPEELAAYLALGKSTVYDLIHRGTIPAVRFGRRLRIPKSAVLTAPAENSV